MPERTFKMNLKNQFDYCQHKKNKNIVLNFKQFILEKQKYKT